jgi:hypothetical protein
MQSRYAVILGIAVLACADPVHDGDVDALGPEVSGVPKGPDHRPGQPCLTCHGGNGPASFVMSFGGTVYSRQTSTAPAVGATVQVVGADQRTYETKTNSVGNFWIPEREFQPSFPVNAAVTLGRYSRVMRTEMRLDGSCNGCHAGTESSGSPGHVWVTPASP